MNCVYAHGSHKAETAEDRLCVVEGHQIVGSDVAGIIWWHCVRQRNGGTTNRYLGAISPISRYVRELESRLTQVQEMRCCVCARWTQCREAREWREENTPGGREVREFLWRSLKGVEMRTKKRMKVRQWETGTLDRCCRRRCWAGGM